jgi:hypothetical protein
VDKEDDWEETTVEKSTLDKNLAVLEGNTKPTEGNTTVKDDTQSILDKLLTMVEQNSKAISNLRSQPTRDKGGSSGKPRPKSKLIACYGCGGDHFLRDCPTRKAVGAIESETAGNEESSC